ncbi:MAG: sigma-54 dependent transcriptional regulator [Pseudomonadota bacterium]|nr:sigma-54 dependent transcriptional regulator [Pseudomonadota bacterium]
MANILIIEDDEVFGELLTMHLEDQGHDPRLARSIEEGRRMLAERSPDAVLVDHQLPDGLGLDLLRELAVQPGHIPVIMLTGTSDNRLAIDAMRIGAFDFIRKPLDELELDTTLANALRDHRLSRQVSAITSSEDYQVDVGQIVGSSPAILNVCKTVGSVATTNASVLITGESGTGKEIVARAIHHHSGRSGLFLPINCSALAENLLESELFGHERGSFTGAVSSKEGKFELAIDGTLFLDELGDMPLALQAKLLRVLQEGTFERVGGTQSLYTNARILAATNRDIKALIREGRFREDLYFRLNVIEIDLPPMRERRQDLSLLVEHLVRKTNAREHTAIRHIADGAWRVLRDYDWPGNVRELENTLTRAAVLARNDTITSDLLALPHTFTTDGPSPSRDEENRTLRLVPLEQVEREHVLAILEHTGWHKGKACEILGISRPALDRRISKYRPE